MCVCVCVHSRPCRLFCPSVCRVSAWRQGYKFDPTCRFSLFDMEMVYPSHYADLMADVEKADPGLHHRMVIREIQRREQRERQRTLLAESRRRSEKQ